jgi:hypothetical protein
LQPQGLSPVVRAARESAARHAAFGFGTDPAGKAMVAVNVRCLEGVEPATLKIMPFDGRSR